jgi:PKD repeat protein
VPASALVDEKVSFADSTVNATSRVWDFGDSTETSAERFPTHRYKHAGRYIVALMVNNSCRDVQQIDIKPQPAIQMLAQIQGPTGQVTVGDKVPFMEKTEGATAWEWTFGESGKVDARAKEVSYAFQSAGYKTVTVYVNSPNGKLSGTFTVNVKNKDTDVKPQMVTPKEIAGAAKPTGAAKKALFETKLRSFLSQDNFSARNKLVTDMEQLVCGNNIQVLWITPVLKKNKKKGFDDFCREVIGDKDTYNISELSVDFDFNKDCVNGVTVKMKAK